MKNFPQYISDMVEIYGPNLSADDDFIDEAYSFVTKTESNWTEGDNRLFERYLSDESNVDTQLVVFTMYMNVGDVVKAMYPKEWQELRDRFERDNLVADLKDTGTFFDIRDIKESVRRFIQFKGGK